MSRKGFWEVSPLAAPLKPTEAASELGQARYLEETQFARDCAGVSHVVDSLYAGNVGRNTELVGGE